MKILFWVSLGIIVYTYVGYPLAIAGVAGVLRLPRRFAPRNDVRGGFGPCNDGGELPTVSMIISVYNEEGVIREKIENCLGIDYPEDKLEILIGSDGSTDGTNGVLEEYLRLLPPTPRLRVIVNDVRRGKPDTINQLVREATGEILFFTDARQDIAKDALRMLVRNFTCEKKGFLDSRFSRLSTCLSKSAGPRREEKNTGETGRGNDSGGCGNNIGCVSGELLYKESSSITGRGVSVYWKYEKFLREKESEVHSMIGATGAIYACRRELFEELPGDIILDDMYTPLQIVRKGYRAIFDRGALAYDEVGETPRDEYRRKIRTLSGNYQIFFKMPDMLNPFKSKLAIQIISHKLLRVVVPFFMIALFVSNMILLKELFFGVFFVAQTMFYGIAIVEAVFRKKIMKIFGIPYLFCLLNVSALIGFWNFLFKRMSVKWEKATT